MPTDTPLPRLDDDTERLINLMDYRDRRSGYSGPSGLADALRKRILELQEIARKGGREDALKGAVTVTFPEPTKFLGDCNCAFKSPTVPTCRDPMEHLADCPASGSGYPVGTFVLTGRDVVGQPPCYFCKERHIHKKDCTSRIFPRLVSESKP